MARSLEKIDAALDSLDALWGFEVLKGLEDCNTCSVAVLEDAPVGFAYYHAQNVENWDEDGAMHIGFSDVRAGRAVTEALMAQGLFVRWDGTDASKIEVRE